MILALLLLANADLEAARRIVPVDAEVRVEVEKRGDRPAGVVARTKRVEGGYAIVLYEEPLRLRAHDPVSTLAHELVHVRQKDRWGALTEVRMPPWVVEGMAVYLSGQLAARARVLAAHAGREKEPADPLPRLVNGLGGRHGLQDYFEDGAAFAAVDARHGKEKAAAFVEALLSGERPSRAVRVLGESEEEFAKRSREWAVAYLRPLLKKGRASVLALRAHYEAKEFAAMADVPAAGGVYGVDDAYYRALGLAGIGRAEDALELLRTRFLDARVRSSTLLMPALRLERRLLAAADRPARAN